MADVKIAVGDQVRVLLHPAGPWKSFSEGVVRRVDVITPEGRFFVIEVTHEVLLDRKHRIGRGFPGGSRSCPPHPSQSKSLHPI